MPRLRKSRSRSKKSDPRSKKSDPRSKKRGKVKKSDPRSKKRLIYISVSVSTIKCVYIYMSMYDVIPGGIDSWLIRRVTPQSH